MTPAPTQPPAPPPWATPALVRLTRDTWGPKYARELSDADCARILTAAGEAVDLVASLPGAKSTRQEAAA